MKTLHLNAIKADILVAVRAAGFDLSFDQLQLDKTKTLEHGHFATNVAMILAGPQKQNPREVAQKIVDQLKGEWLEKVEIAGPGFINLFIKDSFYTKELQVLTQDLDQFTLESLSRKETMKVVVEHSSPNIAKPLGIHNLLSTVIGDSLQKIRKAYGDEVVVENYPGDMGTQFGKLIYAIKTWGDEAAIERSPNPIELLLELYVKFHDLAEKNPELDDFGRAEYKKFEDGDLDSRAMWKKIVDWSFKDLNPLYDRLGIQFDAVHGESFFEDKLQPLIQEGQEKGIFIEGEGGALIVPSDDPDEPPAIIQKSDGATLYLTRDLAQMDFFESEYQPDLVVWAVDVSQSLHFKQRFAVYKKLRKTDTMFVHAVFGRMKFKDLKMSTRKGNIIFVSKVLDESAERAEAKILEKNAEIDSEELKHLAETMGINSIKYNILSQNRVTDLTFDWDRMLSFEGNSAPYLMYTVARAKSVLRKAGLNELDLSQFELNLELELEKQLAIDLMLYPEVIARAAEEFKPNLVANYLYDLASTFNSFYNGNPILKVDEATKNSRLLLTTAVIRVMEDAFALLGMEVVERM